MAQLIASGGNVVAYDTRPPSHLRTNEQTNDRITEALQESSQAGTIIKEGSKQDIDSFCRTHNSFFVREVNPSGDNRKPARHIRSNEDSVLQASSVRESAHENIKFDVSIGQLTEEHINSANARDSNIQSNEFDDRDKFRQIKQPQIYMNIASNSRS